MNKRLMRSNDRVIAGVCSGIAEYLDFDICTCFSGVIFYIVCWIVMPEKNWIEQK